MYVKSEKINSDIEDTLSNLNKMIEKRELEIVKEHLILDKECDFKCGFDFKISNKEICEMISNLLLDEKKLLLTHDTTISKGIEILYKHKNTLYTSEILNVILKKLNIKCESPDSVLKEKYFDYYKIWEQTAKNQIEKIKKN